MVKKQTEAKETRQVAVKDTTIDPELLVLQIANELRSSRERGWNIGAAAHQLAEVGYTDDSIANMVSEQGVPVERPTINLHRLNYEFYIVKYGLDPKEMLRWTVRQVSAIRRIVAPYQPSKETLLEILRRAEGKGVKDSADIAARAVGKRNLSESDFKNLSLPTPIVERLHEFGNYLQGIADAAGDKVRVTPTITVEFALAILEAFDREVLLRLWREAHGETTEEDYGDED